jgi:hypothetical protein
MLCQGGSEAGAATTAVMTRKTDSNRNFALPLKTNAFIPEQFRMPAAFRSEPPFFRGATSYPITQRCGLFNTGSGKDCIGTTASRQANPAVTPGRLK